MKRQAFASECTTTECRETKYEVKGVSFKQGNFVISTELMS